MTELGAIVGTLHYMPPEVLRGQGADARSDLWALGVMLHEMCAGELPFGGETGFAVSSAILIEPPKPLPARVPPGVVAVIHRCLAKEPAQRYQRASEVQAVLEAAQTGGAAMEVRRPKLAISRRAVLLAAGVLAVILALTAGSLLLRPKGPAGIESLAVLPLENLSGDAGQDYFADGMTDILIGDLAKIGSLRVISRPSVMRYKGSRQALPEIARELRVDAIVTGSVLRSGEKVRITAQLIEAASEKHLWAENYERDLRDVLGLQGEVARAIAGEIRVKLTPQEQVRLAKARVVNPEALDHYLRGKYHANRENPDDNKTALTLLERAVAIDPGMAAAHAELARACQIRLFYFAPQEKQWAERAFVEVERALSLDSELAEAYLSRGLLLWSPANNFLHERAVQEYRRAISLNPNLDEAYHQMALVYIHTGLPEKAHAALEKAVSINPTNTLARYRIGENFMYQFRDEEALAVFNSVSREFNPALWGFHTAWTMSRLGRRAEASSRIAESLRDSPADTGGVLSSVQAIMLAASGQQRLAEEAIRRAIEKGKGFGHFHHTAYNIATAYAVMKQAGPALRWLQQAADTGFPCYPVLERDRNLDPIREDPGFAGFLEKARKQWEHFRAVL